MMYFLKDMIEIKKGYIENSPREYGVDAIVNAANPTLMGSDSNVDGSIHKAEAYLQKKKDALKIQIKEIVDGNSNAEDNIIRCKRGTVVVTGQHLLCNYIFHTVGPQNDKDNTRPKVCSSSRIRILESCYKNIILETVKRPDIKKIAIPVISAGNYEMPYDLAFKIGLTTVYNTLLEIKQRDREFFDYMGLEKVYFIIPDTPDNHLKIAENVLIEYQKVFWREHRAVSNNSYESQKYFWKEISLYDERRGYFSIARRFRVILVCLRIFLFYPLTYIKDLLGKQDWVYRRKAVEVITLLKVLFPLFGYFLIKAVPGKGISYGIVVLALYNLLDTVTYLLALIILADIQKPSANIIRSMILLCVNYIEVSLDISVLYFVKNCEKVGIGKILETAVLGENLGIPMIDWVDYGIHYLDKGVKFFFLTLAFGYFANHLRQRNFRQVEDVM